jgi:6-phosphogluconolactonase
MKPHRIPIAASVRLLAVVITWAMMTSCHSGGPGCSTPSCTSVLLEGTLSGLVGSQLVLNNPQNNLFTATGFSGSMANGTQLTFGSAPYNTAYNLTVQSQPVNPSQTCVVTNGSGTAGTTDVTDIAVTCTTDLPRFAYIVNRGSNSISAYTVDPATGTLAVIAGSPFAAGKLPVAIAVDRTGHFAYVVNQTDATLSAFIIDRSSGTLTEVSGSPFTTGLSPTSVAIDPSSSFVYVANGGAGSVSAYAISASGALTAITGSPYAAGNSPSSVAVDTSGFYVEVTNKGDDTFSVFSIQDGVGSLMVAPGSPVPTEKDPQAVVADGQVFVANGTANSLSSFAAVGTGQVSEDGASPYPTGTNPISIAVDDVDHFVYVANQGSNNISGFNLRNDGFLVPLAASPFAAGSEPSALAIENTGKFAYVVNNASNSMSVYAIDAASGALSPIGGSPFATGTQPAAIAISD